MKKFGTWYFDLARCWDGSYPHQGPPENEHDSFHGFDATGTYLLAFAMPLKKIRDARYSACQALSKLGQKGEPAVESLQNCLNDKDLWLRVNAASHWE